MPLPLAIATGGMRDTTLRLGNFTWGSFKDRLRKPQIGGKDGSYYIRGSELRQPKRSDENLLSAKTIILDGDSSINPETGEIVSGAPDLNEVVTVLKDMGITFCAHTSHSFVPGELWKYRIIIPADIPNQEYLDASVNWLVSQLHARGIWLADVTENHRWSQPWYSSRVRDREALKDFMFIEHEANTFPLLTAMDAHKLAQKRQEKEEQARRLQPVSMSPEGNIQAFNKSFTLNDARGLLESAGYRFGYYEKGKDAYRFMRPGSETKTYGVVLFKGAMGDWCTYSHHGSADPLSSRVCDPFELVATLKYSGDLKACARAIFPKEKSVVEKLAERSKILPPSSENTSENFPEKSTFENPMQLSEKTAFPNELPVKKRVNLIPWSELRDEPVRWLVDGLLPANSFCAIFGKPGSYKSFAALGMAAAIATGTEFLGRSTTQGPVLFIAAEGSAGLRRRRDSIIKHHNLPADLPIWFVKAQLNLATTTEDLDLLLQEIRAIDCKPSLIVIDTWARVTNSAEENSASEMGAAIAICGTLQQETGACVLIVHHSSKGAEQMRGSSAILAAVDAELYCEKLSKEGGSDDRLARLRITKMKDGEDDVEIPFRAVTVPLSDIDPSQTSLALELVSDEELAGIKNPSKPKVSKDAEAVLAALEMAIAEGGSIPPIGDRAPRGTKAVSNELWKGYWRKITTKEKGAAETAYSRAKETLKKAGRINNWGNEWYWIVKETAPQDAGPFPQRVVASFDDMPFD